MKAGRTQFMYFAIAVEVKSLLRDPSGWIEDLHSQAVDHARPTRKAPLDAGLRIRGLTVQYSQHRVSLVRPFCVGLGAVRWRVGVAVARPMPLRR
jgi:hypothetical protein